MCPGQEHSGVTWLVACEGCRPHPRPFPFWDRCLMTTLSLCLKGPLRVGGWHGDGAQLVIPAKAGIQERLHSHTFTRRPRPRPTD